MVKESTCNAGDAGAMGSIPGLGRTPGEGNGNPLQDSCLGIAMDRGTWWVTVHEVTKMFQLSWMCMQCACACTHIHTHTHTHTHTQRGYNRGSRRAFLENKFKEVMLVECICVLILWRKKRTCLQSTSLLNQMVMGTNTEEK